MSTSRNHLNSILLWCLLTSDLHSTLETPSKETQMFSWKKICCISQTWLSWEKSMPRVRMMTFFITSRPCSTTTTSPLWRSRLGRLLSCRRIRLSIRYRLKRWMGSERTFFRSIWGIPLRNNRVDLLALLKRPHSEIISCRRCWWTRSAEKTCLRLLSLLDFLFLPLLQRQECFSNHSWSRLRKALSLTKKEVKS